MQSNYWKRQLVQENVTFPLHSTLQAFSRCTDWLLRIASAVAGKREIYFSLWKQDGKEINDITELPNDVCIYGMSS